MKVFYKNFYWVVPGVILHEDGEKESLLYHKPTGDFV